MVKQVEDIKKSSVIIRENLTAGQTGIIVSDDRITTESILSFYTSIYGVSPTAVTVTTGSVELTFEAQAEDMEVGVRVDG